MAKTLSFTSAQMSPTPLSSPHFFPPQSALSVPVSTHSHTPPLHSSPCHLKRIPARKESEFRVPTLPAPKKSRVSTEDRGHSSLMESRDVPIVGTSSQGEPLPFRDIPSFVAEYLNDTSRCRDCTHSMQSDERSLVDAYVHRLEDWQPNWCLDYLSSGWANGLGLEGPAWSTNTLTETPRRTNIVIFSEDPLAELNGEMKDIIGGKVVVMDSLPIDEYHIGERKTFLLKGGDGSDPLGTAMDGPRAPPLTAEEREYNTLRKVLLWYSIVLHYKNVDTKKLDALLSNAPLRAEDDFLVKLLLMKKCYRAYGKAVLVYVILHREPMAYKWIQLNLLPSEFLPSIPAVFAEVTA